MAAKEIRVPYKDSFVYCKLDLNVSQMDGKLILLACGCGGAHCTGCTATQEDIMNPEKILEGFKMNRGIEWCNILYWLLEDENMLGSTNYALREGLTQQPLLTTLECTASIPVLHAWIRFLTFFEHLIYHQNSRYAFPNGEPFWGRGLKKGPQITAAVKKEAGKVRDKAKATMGLLLDAPDPAGTGGTTDTANNGRLFFSPKNRQGVLNLFNDLTYDQREALQTILKDTNVVLRVINSTKEIKVLSST
jgi:hypothetical protein